ncbi:MAG: HAD family hydrolase [Paracoccaceae bacterium]
MRAHAEAWTFVLATDLDGTFLGGTDGDRRQLYDWIGKHRASVGLIFVTGRDPKFIEGMCGDGFVPWPDFVVGDVGTTIAKMAPVGPGGEVRPMMELEEAIAEAWGDAGDKVRERLDGWPGLTLQPEPHRFRVSYDLDPKAFDEDAKGAVEEMGLDWLVSDDRFFDVLPRGVSKGPSLLRLTRRLGITDDRVLVAGDTLNDLSMLSQDAFRAVAVGNSEAELLARLPDSERVLKAEGEGAAGIMDAISHFGLHDPAPRGIL